VEYDWGVWKPMVILSSRFDVINTEYHV
jgi:hypothetical protein